MNMENNLNGAKSHIEFDWFVCCVCVGGSDGALLYAVSTWINIHEFMFQYKKKK